MAPPKASTKKAAVGRTATGRSDDNQAKNEDPPTQVAALDDRSIGGEKKMAYRKRLDSDAEISVSSPSDNSSQAPTSEVRTKSIQVAEERKKPFMAFNARLCDAVLKGQIHYVCFTWKSQQVGEMTIAADKEYFLN